MHNITYRKCFPSGSGFSSSGGGFSSSGGGFSSAEKVTRNSEQFI